MGTWWWWCGVRKKSAEVNENDRGLWLGEKGRLSRMTAMPGGGERGREREGAKARNSQRDREQLGGGGMYEEVDGR